MKTLHSVKNKVEQAACHRMAHALYCFLLFLICVFVCPQFSFAQKDTVQHHKTSDNIHAVFTVKSYCKKKKQVLQDATLIAIRQVLFKGIPNTMFWKPLFPEGESVAFKEHELYFTELINKRCLDFLEIKQISDFKGEGKNKKERHTVFEVKANVLQLRRDLEKNNIIKRLGF